MNERAVRGTSVSKNLNRLAAQRVRLTVRPVYSAEFTINIRLEGDFRMSSEGRDDDEIEAVDDGRLTEDKSR